MGLLIGKPLGIFSFSWLAVKSGVAKLPEGVNFIHILRSPCSVVSALPCQFSSPHWRLVAVM